MERSVTSGKRTMKILMPISGKAVAAFLAGMGSVLSGFLALSSTSDHFLAAVPLFWLLALVLGIRGYGEIRRSAGGLAGRSLALWGMCIPAVGFFLGFLLLPAT